MYGVCIYTEQRNRTRCVRNVAKQRGGSEKRMAKKSKVSGRDGSMRQKTAIKAWGCGDVCGGEDRGVPRFCETNSP